MFIRIKRRKVSDCHRKRRGLVQPKDKTALDFVIVESVRTEKGPRQRVVKHIGSLLERFVNLPNVTWFYRDQVEPALRTVCADAKPGAYEKLMADMERKLPRLPK
jgi:hypothetical protein